MKRPYRVPGIGWILALAVLVFAALALVGIVNVTPKMELLMIAGVALAILI
jgi:heme A synthase